VRQHVVANLGLLDELKAGGTLEQLAAGLSRLHQPRPGTRRHVGPLLIVAHYLRELGVAEVVDHAIPRRGKALASHGKIACVLAANRLACPAPLYDIAGWGILGSFSSLVPTFLNGILGVRNLALIGATSFLIFITAAVSQAVSAGLPARRSVSAGLPLLLVCLAALEAALFAKALWLFLAGTVVGGIAVGLSFRGGLSELNRLAEPRHRAAVVSTFFAAAYLGLGLPALLTGLISQLTGTVDASVWTSGLVAAIVVTAIVVVSRTFGAAAARRNRAARARATGIIQSRRDATAPAPRRIEMNDAAIVTTKSLTRSRPPPPSASQQTTPAPSTRRNRAMRRTTPLARRGEAAHPTTRPAVYGNGRRVFQASEPGARNWRAAMRPQEITADLPTGTAGRANEHARSSISPRSGQRHMHPEAAGVRASTMLAGPVT
jgi:hypothetical protein